MAIQWTYIEKFGCEVLIDDDHPLAIAQRARQNASVSPSPTPPPSPDRSRQPSKRGGRQ